MPPSESAEELWVERSRLSGMVLGAVSYGIFFQLVIEFALTLRRRSKQGKPVRREKLLHAYNFITFTLATIGFAANVRYTQMIWIDLRDVEGGPVSLIFLEMDYWVNRMALSCYYVMEWFMQGLLLYRCFFIWDYARFIVIPLTSIFLAMIATSIMVLVKSNGAGFYNVHFQVAYLSLSVGLTILYSILFISRILWIRKMIIETLGADHARVHTSIVPIVIESVAPYSALGIIFIVSFAVHSSVTNLVFLSISHVQGISQLLILLRVARGESFSEGTFSEPTRSSVVFNRDPSALQMQPIPPGLPTFTSSDSDPHDAQHVKNLAEWGMSRIVVPLSTKSMP